MDFVVFIYLKQLMYSKKKINDYIYIKFMSRRNDHEQLIENVKSWIGLDEELKTLRKKARALRGQKKNLTSSLVSIMKDNDIDCFDITDGQLIRTTRQVKTPLSKKHLLTSLTRYFQNDSKVVKELSTFIMNSRESKTKEDIRRKINLK